MDQIKNLCSKIGAILEPEDIKINELMKDHTSFKVGGPVDIMVTPHDYEQVRKIMELCKEEEIPYYILGFGSNLLIRDKGIRGIVIKLTNLNSIRVEGEKIIAESGASLIEASKTALSESLTGLEFACGIPGSVGGAATMNAGAYDGDVSKVIESILVIDDKGTIRRLHGDEFEYGYRMSSILKYGYIVLEVVFALKKGDYEKIKHRMDELTFRREDKQPLEYPSAGSTFKRPEGYFTGKLIEDCMLKGTCIGGAQVSEKHAGFIINKGSASAKDILDLIEHIQKIVHEKYGVQLHTEVRILGED